MFQIRAGGINARHNASFSLSRPNGLGYHVLLFVKVKAVFSIAGNSFGVSPNSALFIHRNTPYEYHSAAGDYCDDWLHFSCSAKDLEELSDIPAGSPVPLPNPALFTLYIRQLLWENSYTPDPYRTDNVDMLFRILLNTMRHSLTEPAGTRNYHPCHAKLRNLRLTILAQPYKNYSPDRLAASCGISVSSFQHLYTELFGISFRADLIGLRIEYAKDLIQNTNLTMEKIAEMCGYNSEVHFYRQFKKYTGMTPAACRRNKNPDGP